MVQRPSSSGGSFIASTLVVCAGVGLCLMILLFFSRNPNAEVPVAALVILSVVFGAIAIALSSIELPGIEFRLPWRRRPNVIRYKLRRKRRQAPPVPGSEAYYQRRQTVRITLRADGEDDHYGRSTWVPAGDSD
jgi:hypothetical protein